MKHYLAIVCLLLVACGRPAMEVPVGEFRVEKIFEVDGCIGYRFFDFGAPRYFVSCGTRTKTSWETTQMIGKVPITRHHEISTEHVNEEER